MGSYRKIGDVAENVLRTGKDQKQLDKAEVF